MRKSITGMLVLIVVVGLLARCGKDSKQAEENFSEVDILRTQVKPEGVFFIDGYTMLMKFYDFKLDKSIPICDKPNCRHDSADCNAFLMNGFLSGMGCYREKLYFFDVTDPELVFYQADKNGTNRKVIAKVNKEGRWTAATISMPMFFVEDEVYFGVTYTEFLEEPLVKEDGTITEYEDYWILGKINLKSGVFKVIKEPEILESSQSWMQIRDYVNGKIVYSKGHDVHVFDVNTAEDEVVLAENGDECRYLDSIRGMSKLFYEKNEENTSSVYAIELPSKKEERIVEKEKQKGKICIPKEAYQEKDWKKIQVIESY